MRPTGRRLAVDRGGRGVQLSACQSRPHWSEKEGGQPSSNHSGARLEIHDGQITFVLTYFPSKLATRLVNRREPSARGLSVGKASSFPGVPHRPYTALPFLRQRTIVATPGTNMEAAAHQVWCSCYSCVIDNFGRPKLTDRITMYRHRMARGLPPDADGSSGSAVPGPTLPDGSMDVAEQPLPPAPLPAALNNAADVNDDDDQSDDDDESDSSDASTVPEGVLLEEEMLHDLLRLGVNGACLSLEHFRWAIDDIAEFVFAAHHNLRRSTVSDFLKLRGGYRRLQTPARVATFARSSVNLVALDVSCCRNGCMAFTTDDDAVTCVHCNARRFKNGSVPSMVVPYWPITPWLRMMLLDPELSVAMRDYMVIARQRAAEEDVASYSDWYDGASFRKMVKDGLIVSNADIVFGVALDGFDSWRQTGCKGWPVVVTVLSLPPEMRTKTVCMLPVMITPGPGELIDLDSFLRPLLVELHSLAAGVAGVSIYEGEEHGHTLRAFCVQVTTDMPAGQTVTHMTGHAGYTHPTASGHSTARFGVRPTTFPLSTLILLSSSSPWHPPPRTSAEA